MPEGPEIRLAADKVAQAIVGQAPVEVSFAFEHLKPYEQELTGTEIYALETHGKAMLTRFANGLNIYSHNQLYGRWEVRDAYDFPDTNRQLRLAIHTEKKSALLYSASDIEVLNDDELADHPFLSQIGPDLLDPALTVEQVAARYASERFRRRRFTGLLLDQHFLAGTGNYLRSEILHVAGVHPNQRPMDLTDEQVHRLAQATLDLTRQSYDTKGVTNDLDRARELKQVGKSYGQYRFHVFNREDQMCYTCGGPVIKEVLGGRRIYFCETCQPTP